MLLPDDDGFEEAAVGRVFNARRPAERPAAVMLAASEDDVVEAVRYARDRGLRVSVRSGGHSWAAWSVRADAVLIDLGGLQEMTFDATTGIATASPSVQGGGRFAPFLESHGRMFPGGHCTTVGLGGFLLQGGQGWNSRRWGWGCENVVAVDVVTADGSLVRADPDQNTDLFWAVRGSGPGFFGVVTRLHLRTYERPQMTQDTWTFALADAEPLLSWLHDLLPRLDIAVEPVIAATCLPDVPLFDGVARPDEPVLLLHTTTSSVTADEADRMLAPLRDCPFGERALGHVTGPTTIAEENAAQDIQNPEGHRYRVDCQWTNASAAALAPRLRAMWSELPTEHSFSIWYGWAPTRSLPDMAFSLEANVYLATYVIYPDEADDDARYSDWLQGHMRGLAVDGEGVYLGDSDFRVRPDRFMSDEAFERLQAIRAERDPDGMFCAWPIVGGATLNARPSSPR